jgi:hypothetical protein
MLYQQGRQKGRQKGDGSSVLLALAVESLDNSLTKTGQTGKLSYRHSVPSQLDNGLVLLLNGERLKRAGGFRCAQLAEKRCGILVAEQRMTPSTGFQNIRFSNVFLLLNNLIKRNELEKPLFVDKPAIRRKTSPKRTTQSAESTQLLAGFTFCEQWQEVAVLPDSVRNPAIIGSVCVALLQLSGSVYVVLLPFSGSVCVKLGFSA